MAALQKIRNRGTLLGTIIGLALLAFIAGDALKSGSSLFSSSKNEIAEIAGESISIKDFQNEVKSNEIVTRMMTGQNALNSQQQDQLREQVWQQIVNRNVMTSEYEDLGIDVSPEELSDMVFGRNIDPLIQQIFRGQDGQVDKEKVVSTLQQLMAADDSTPQKQYWLKIESDLKIKRSIEKYNSLLSKGLYTPKALAEHISKTSSTKSDISYIVKSYNSIADSTVSISDSEIQSYYNSHLDLFTQQESRKIEYVEFQVEPSTQDFKSTEAWLSQVKTSFENTTNNVEFVNLKSDKKFASYYFSKGENKNVDLNKFMFSASKNAVSDIYTVGDTYKVAKINNIKMMPDSVKARHILIRPTTSIESAQKQADSIKTLIDKGADFAKLAKKFSKDQGSAVNGGDLSWFKQNKMVKEFNDVAFNSSKNQVSVVTTQFGVHIIQVTGISKKVKKVELAIIERKVEPSQQTFQSVYAIARKFAGNAQTREAFNKSIASQGLRKKIANLNKNSKEVAGLDNSRSIIRSAYKAEDTANILAATDGAQIFEFGNKFIIAALSEIKEEGNSAIKDVTYQIKTKLLKDKKAEILSASIIKNTKDSKSLLSLAQKENTQVKQASSISFQSFQIPGAGIEPKVIGITATLAENTISAPIAGNQGVYVVSVNKNTTTEASATEISTIQSRMQQSYAYRTNRQAYEVLKENANIVDNRYKFY